MANEDERTIGQKIGERVSDLRRGLPLSRAKLAAKIDVNVKTVSRLERGETIPSVSKLAEIAAALDVQLADLFVFEPTNLDAAYREVMNRVTNAKTRAMIRSLLLAVDERSQGMWWRF